MHIEFYGLNYSPWTIQARWALDHHVIHYHYIEHIPMISTVLLRLKARKLFDKITVPILITSRSVVDDSWNIAAWADREGHRSKLIPLDLSDEVKAWHDRADAANHSNRIIVTEATAQSEEAKRENLPDFFPEFSRNVLTPVTDLGIAYLRQKYDFRHSIIAEEKKKVREALNALRAALKGKNHIFDVFTYADIAASGILQYVRPVDDRFVRLKPAIRKVFTQNDLLNEFADLVEWRDRLFQNYRNQPK